MMDGFDVLKYVIECLHEDGVIKKDDYTGLKALELYQRVHTKEEEYYSGEL